MTQAPPAQRITRARIVELGLGQPGWAFLSLAAQALRVAPRDDEVRILAGRSLRSLGLGALAREVVGRVEAGDHGEERDRLLATLDRAGALALDGLIAQARANLGFVEGIDAEGAIEAWVGQGSDYHRASDGNVVRVPRGARDLPGVEWLADLRRGAGEFCRAHLGDAIRKHVGPITIEGVSPPWLVLAIDRATPVLSDGYHPLLQIVQRDDGELVEGFALADLRGVMERSVVLAGPDADERLAQHVRGRFDFQALGPVVPAGTLRVRVQPPLMAIMSRLADEQRAESSRLRAELIARDRVRDAAWWRERWGQPGPKRVLIPTSRHSTFIRHAASDLAGAFEGRGWEARVLIEPDAHSRLSTIAYYRAQLELDPHLIVLINFPRGSRAESFPTRTPFVCWIQDSMPHLFDERVGRGHEARDFVAGHVYPALFRDFGYPHGRALSMPVVASVRKFHGVDVDPVLAERVACDVAYVSHHSQTPAQMHARLCAEEGDPRIVRVLEEMRGLIAERFGSMIAGTDAEAVKRIPADAWARAHGEPPTPRVCDQLREQYVVPMIERMLRHEMLKWASDMCERRGWRLRIFGRGWDRHESLSGYAGGELAHGEALRACYRSAGVHLHASMTTLVHQRVMECALSGGLPLCRVVAPNFGASRQRVLCGLVRAVEPDQRRADGGPVYRVEAHDALRALRLACGRAGFSLPDEIELHPRTAESMRRFPVAFEVETPEGLLGDPGESMFADAASMERLIERALKDQEWRRERSAEIAGRVRERLTHDVLAERVEELVARSL